MISAVEHHAVLDPARWLESVAGADLVEVGVDDVGRLRLDELAAAVDDRTGVVSVMWANNEIGTRQPISAVVEPLVRSERGRTATPCRRSVMFRWTLPRAGWTC